MYNDFNLDLEFDHITQEMYDRLVTDKRLFDNNYYRRYIKPINCYESRVVNASDPINDKDLVTKIYLDQTSSSINQLINEINSKIPEQASATNQLADKKFVNSTVQTSTACFEGSWDTYADIPDTIQGFEEAGYTKPTNNDYLVVKEDETHDDEEWRYKYSESDEDAPYSKTKWKPEYKINNTPFTEAQRSAINSGITQEKVDNMAFKPDTELSVQYSDTWEVDPHYIGFDDPLYLVWGTNWSGWDNITSGWIVTNDPENVDPEQESCKPKGTLDSLELSWDTEEQDIVDATITAERESKKHNVIGYQLGDQSTKILAPKKYVDDLFSDFNYVRISISTFTVSKANGANTSSVEYGTTVTSVTLSYTFSKEAIRATLDGGRLLPVDEHSTIIPTGSNIYKSGTIALTGLNCTSTKTWNMTATDAGSPSNPEYTTGAKQATLSFLSKCYYGSYVDTTINDNFLLTKLSNTGLTNTKNRSITYQKSADGQYMWYAAPVDLGECSFAVGGFSGGFEKVATFLHTNASGGKKNYNVYKSVERISGSTKVDIT